jgi:hypothetical protein
LRIRDRSINRSREKSRENSRLEGVLSREKLSKEKRWSLQMEGGGGGKPLENGFFRRENGEFSREASLIRSLIGHAVLILTSYV